ncbi:MAG: 2-isopropylmalate synthase [Patescibacteria group bacterium]|nr:2-isopropylmalate synthase [Patescibacteria group bacterium]MDE1965721.1 2-isopropylmalate synthase [Patescibacteria group bacterium]
MTNLNEGLERVIIFDTTLRDGEQSPGAAMTYQQKLEVAEMLDAMGVDVIEAGFPIASPGDFTAVADIAKRTKRAVVCGLARTGVKDIERAGEALKGAARPRIHTFISTSPVHMQYKLKMGPNAVLDAIGASVTLARRYTDDVEWSAEDATRTEWEFLVRCVELAIRSGATTINIPDTVGYATADEYYQLIMRLRTTVADADTVVFSTHCHDDLGHAVANSIAGVRAGARQVECSMNGIGERAGNAALEEIVMALRVRNDLLPYRTDVDPTFFARASKLVANATGLVVPPNKAIVGKNAFAHESGIHQDGMLKHVETYEIMRPEDVGAVGSLPLGKLSGRHAFHEKLAALGIALDEETIGGAFARFKLLADTKKEVFDDDLVAIIGDLSASMPEADIVELTYTAGRSVTPHAAITIRYAGETYTGEASGDGSVDAAIAAIRDAYPHYAELVSFIPEAVTRGADSQARVSVTLSKIGKTASASAVHTDTVEATALAYLRALAKLEASARAAPTDPPT